MTDNKYIGNKYGKLTILEFIKKEGSSYLYKTKCDCGNYCIKNIYEISRKSRNNPPNCGCTKKIQINENQQSYIGKKFNNLTILEFVGKQNNNPLYKYQCDCGTIKESVLENIRRSKTCGCKNIKYKIGDIYQNYKILEIDKSRSLVECLVCNEKRKLKNANLNNKLNNTCVCKTGYNIKVRSLNKEDQFILKVYRKFINSIKYRRNKEVDIDFNDYKSLVLKNCEYCDADYKTHSSGLNGLDRIDSNKGYLLDNVVPCCYDCNIMKSDMKKDEFFKHIEKIYTKYKKEK